MASSDVQNMEVLTIVIVEWPYEKASIGPFPIKVAIMLRHRKMNPIVPKPPNSPFFGTNLHGPSNKKLAIPLEAEIIEVANVAMKKGSKSVKYNKG